MIEKNVNFLMLLSIMALSFTSCQKSILTKKDGIILQTMIDKWEENGINGNRLANADFFTEDGIRIQGGKTYKGKEKTIRKLFSSPEEQKTYLKQENKVDRIWASKKSITVTSTVSYLNKATGDTVTTSVAAISVFERQKDGSLKIAYSLKD